MAERFVIPDDLARAVMPSARHDLTPDRFSRAPEPPAHHRRLVVPGPDDLRAEVGKQHPGGAPGDSPGPSLCRISVFCRAGSPPDGTMDAGVAYERVEA
jgi:hypothetical protein